MEAKEKIVKLNISNPDDLTNKIIELILSGVSKGDLVEQILSNSTEKIKEDEALGLINQAIEKLGEIIKEEPCNTINSHLQHYEIIFDYFKSIQYAAGVNKALKAKEKLAGLFREDKLTINQNITTVFKREISFDRKKLTTEKQNRLDYLIKKATV